MCRADRWRRSPKLGSGGFLSCALCLGAVLTGAACRKTAPPSAAAAGGAGPSDPASSGEISPARPTLPSPTVLLEAGGRKVPFRVEVAATEAERDKGLKFRKILTRPSGMLFVFPNDASQTLSMKNTLMPLDMIFIGGDRRIVGIVENALPETEAPRRVDAISRYVLEIGGGLSSRLGVRTGSEVELKGMPPGLFPDREVVGQSH